MDTGSHMSGHKGKIVDAINDLRMLRRLTVRTVGTPRPLDRLRVATYNIHSCIGLDKKTSPERIADIIAAMDTDVVAPQEVDAGRARTGYQDQTAILAEMLKMSSHYFPLLRESGERYGLAILSRFPFDIVKCRNLPGFNSRNSRHETRGAMWVRLRLPHGPVEFFNIHLGLSAKERRLQMRALLGGDWVAAVSQDVPVIFCGDLNAGPRSAAYPMMASVLRDVQTTMPKHRPQATFFSRFPIFRLDHIFISQHFDVVEVRVPGNRKARSASDHLPIVAELQRYKTSGAPHAPPDL